MLQQTGGWRELPFQERGRCLALGTMERLCDGALAPGKDAITTDGPLFPHDTKRFPAIERSRAKAIDSRISWEDAVSLVFLNVDKVEIALALVR